MLRRTTAHESERSDHVDALPRPHVTLGDGNSLAIYAACDRALIRDQWPDIDRWKFQKAFFLCVGTDEVLALVMERFTVSLLTPVEVEV